MAANAAFVASIRDRVALSADSRMRWLKILTLKTVRNKANAHERANDNDMLNAGKLAVSGPSIAKPKACTRYLGRQVLT